MSRGTNDKIVSQQQRLPQARAPTEVCARSQQRYAVAMNRQTASTNRRQAQLKCGAARLCIQCPSFPSIAFSRFRPVSRPRNSADKHPAVVSLSASESVLSIPQHRSSLDRLTSVLRRLLRRTTALQPTVYANSGITCTNAAATATVGCQAFNFLSEASLPSKHWRRCHDGKCCLNIGYPANHDGFAPFVVEAAWSDFC